MTRLSMALAAAAVVSWPTASPAQTTADRHQYTITVRVRPLVVFWITRSGVGDAVLTRRVGPDEARYSLLIGSDPDRAPMHINRWGYIEEEIQGMESRLIGLMTQSDEESIEQAEAGVRHQANGLHPFKVIQASGDGQESHSRVRSIVAPQDYSLRQLSIVLDLARHDETEGRSRVLRVPAGARPGFLSAIADAMQDSAPNPIPYVYFGRLYELRRTRSARLAAVRVGDRAYGPAIDADFVTTSTHDREQTRFSMTYGVAGPYAGVPFRVHYSPRWWMQVELTIAPSGEGERP